MEITEVRIKLMEEPGERLKAFCSITFDNCFVVRDLKIIEGTNGPFVAMPSRKLTSHCPRCRSKNHLRAQHCNQCGSALSSDRLPVDNDGRAKLYADIAHPINSACREMIQNRVIEEFEQEIERSQQPDYVSRYDDFDVDFEEPQHAPPSTSNSQPSPRAPSSPSKQSRVDKAHDQAESHAPRSGGASELANSENRGPVPPPKSSPASVNQPPVSSEGDFGAGIFPEN